MTKERQAWDRFLATGKVEDYLACVGKAQSVCTTTERERNLSKEQRNDRNEDSGNGVGQLRDW